MARLTAGGRYLLRPFTPRHESADRLEARTVGRGPLLDVLAARLDSAATTENKHHTLLVGPRGSGKTHLIRVALNQLTRRPQISERLAIADIDEDLIGITRYADLLREIALSLAVPAPADDSIVAWETAILSGIGDRALVLVVENLDRLFSALGLAGQRDLRSWVETSGRILILAATPALFAGVQKRTEPWFGGLIITPVEELSADDGRRLLSILAQEAGDDGLHSFLQTEVGRARVEALAHFSGGSARIWIVVAEILTVDALDALIPAVEGLIEGLVPYYQSLLWDLSPNHQAIVRQLAAGELAALTPAEIAAQTGISQQTVGKALNLLQENRWVRSEKLPGGDRRQTWYRLREPMLRHHFQWRTAGGEPLGLIIELLRGWYDPRERRTRFAHADAGSEAESYLHASLADEPPRYDFAFNTRDITVLAAEAKRWILGDDPVYTRDCGRYTEACLMAEKHGSAALTLKSRTPAGQDDDKIVSALRELGLKPLPDMLSAAAEATSGDTQAGLRLLAAGMVGRAEPQRAERFLVDLQWPELRPVTRLAVEIETNLWHRKSTRRGQPSHSLDRSADELYRDVLTTEVRADVLCGLLARLAQGLDAGYERGPAFEVYERLVTEQRKLLGHDHPDTLRSRMQLAFYTKLQGDPAIGLARYTSLVADLVRRPGAECQTLEAKLGMAECMGKLGDTGGAYTLFAEVSESGGKFPDRGHWLLERAQNQAAYFRAEASRPHRSTGSRIETSREERALVLAQAGDIDEALALIREGAGTPGHPASSRRGASSIMIRILARSPSEPRGSRLLQQLWRALRGDEAALLKLPDELQALVRDVLGT